jgi:hypothetical protein
MKKTAITLSILALLAGSCGQVTKKQAETNTANSGKTDNLLQIPVDVSYGATPETLEVGTDSTFVTPTPVKFEMPLTLESDPPYDCSDFSNNKNVWETVTCFKGELCLIRGSGLDSIKNNVEKLVAAWDKNNTVKIKLIRTEKDKIFINIPDAEYFTEQSGTTGADMILAELVYTLTEHEKYHLVNIDFIEGSHAVPGTYSRKDFEERFIICER